MLHPLSSMLFLSHFFHFIESHYLSSSLALFSLNFYKTLSIYYNSMVSSCISQILLAFIISRTKSQMDILFLFCFSHKILTNLSHFFHFKDTEFSHFISIIIPVRAFHILKSSPPHFFLKRRSDFPSRFFFFAFLRKSDESATILA